MPQAKKPIQSFHSVGAGFKGPNALKRLNRSAKAAQQALIELRKNTRRDVGQGARDLDEHLRTFISSPRRDSVSLTTALQRNVEQAQKRIASAPAKRSRRPAAPPRREAGAAASRSRTPT